MAAYCQNNTPDLRGLRVAVEVCKNSAAGAAADDFFTFIIPCILQRALQLPEFLASHGQDLRTLRQGRRDSVTIPRELGASLLASMFLCTFDSVAPHHEAMPSVSFKPLLAARRSPEIAKLQMFLHYFNRVARSRFVRGLIKIDRIVGVAPLESEWLDSETLLLPLEVTEPNVGFESAPELAHVDFANMMIGGGVLSGGCVQEEIRFSICPELCLSMLVCPCMLDDEAIQIVGAEQFSAYKGYAHSLRYGGNHCDMADRAPDGSFRTAVLAMDALDLRAGDSTLRGQLSTRNILRELNKSHAAFAPTTTEALQQFPMVATGNWGCGAFGGCAPLKAVLQWASASQCQRKLRYFPFNEDFGPELQDIASRATMAKISVGKLLRAVLELRSETELTTEELEDHTILDHSLRKGRPSQLVVCEAALEPWQLLSQVAKKLSI